MPHRTPFFDSAGRVCLQPATELRHIQGHNNDRHVPGALHDALAPKPSFGPFPCMPPTPRPVPPPWYTSRAGPLVPHRTPFFDSAGSVIIQPATELRHVQGHNNERHVLCALHACPVAPHPAFIRAVSVHASAPRPGPASLVPPGPDLSCRIVRPSSTRQKASSFNQPLSFDTSKVTIMAFMFYVRFTRVPCGPPPSLHSGRLRACLRPTPCPASLVYLPGWTSYPAAYAFLQLGRARLPSTSR